MRIYRLRPGRPGQHRLGSRGGRPALVSACDERDIADSRQGQALRRLGLLLEAYGLPVAQRREVAEAILDNHDWCCAIITDAAGAGHPGFADYWGRVAGTMARARRWCEAHQHDLLAAG